MKHFLCILLFTIVCAALFFPLDSLCDGAEPARLMISEPLPPQPTPYPVEVFNMTDAKFFKWATDQNAEARAEWDEWYKTAPPRWIGCGATIDYRRGRQGSYFGSNYEKGSVHRYQQRFLNPDYVSRPLTIINPYCRPTQPRLVVNPQCDRIVCRPHQYRSVVKPAPLTDSVVLPKCQRQPAVGQCPRLSDRR